MAAGLRSGDRDFPSSSGVSASRSVSKGVRASVSEKTPLLSRISSQERQSNAGVVMKSKLPEYEIPFWQNQPMWSTGLFDCCADVPMCCFTIFFPCFAFGRNAEALDGEKTLVGQLQQCGGLSSTQLHWVACIPPPIEEGYAPSTTSQKAQCRTLSYTASAGHVPFAKSIERFITGALVQSFGDHLLSRLPLRNSTSQRSQQRENLCFNRRRLQQIDTDNLD